MDLLLIPGAFAAHRFVFVSSCEVLIKIGLTRSHPKRLEHASLVVALLNCLDSIVVARLRLDLESLEFCHSRVGTTAATFPVLNKIQSLARLLSIQPETGLIFIKGGNSNVVFLNSVMRRFHHITRKDRLFIHSVLAAAE